MILRLVRGALAFVTVAISIPYTVAIVCNILGGWPQRKDKYARALNPWKVMGLNYVMYQRVKERSKYVLLYFKWTQFYRTADPKTLVKNIPYGRNECALDVHKPLGSSERVPVIIFLYGGAWSSGDKSMYGLLAHELASRTKNVVVCPSYSIYPKGYVDDMVQDVVDCVCWVVDNIEQYGGDPGKIILIGHSAGAHLGALTILELLRDERISVKSSFKFDPAGEGLDELAFAESHYGRLTSLERWKEGLEDSSGSSESFAVVSENGSMADNGHSNGNSLEASTSSIGFLSSSMNSEALESSVSEGYVKAGVSEGLGPEEEEAVRLGDGDDAMAGGDITQPEKDIRTQLETDASVAQDPVPQEAALSGSGSVGDDEEEADDDSGDNDSIVTVRPKDIDRHITLSDLCKSIKLFIGLGGVYSISDHFQHESMRGVEDVSCMTRALYGQDHFDRFSPLEIVQRLEGSLSLPHMVLVHGSSDYIVPPSSSSKFAEALARVSPNVKLRVIPECPHLEICLDLNHQRQEFYDPVMNIILESLNGIS